MHMAPQTILIYPGIALDMRFSGEAKVIWGTEAGEPGNRKLQCSGYCPYLPIESLRETGQGRTDAMGNATL